MPENCWRNMTTRPMVRPFLAAVVEKASLNVSFWDSICKKTIRIYKAWQRSQRPNIQSFETFYRLLTNPWFQQSFQDLPWSSMVLERRHRLRPFPLWERFITLSCYALECVDFTSSRIFWALEISSSTLYELPLNFCRDSRAAETFPFFRK